MSTWEGNYLAHHGIKGQQWGVRRFQNEDGSLTEEGRKRYLKTYDEAEKQADEEIKRAEGQIADIQKNGWKAKSAFTSGFIKDLKREGILDNPVLSKSYLDMFENTFKQDLKEAKLSKKIVQEARSFIEKNANVTYDDLLRESVKTDNKHKTDVEGLTRKIGDELGLEEKTSKINVYGDSKALKEIKNKYSKKDMENLVDQASAAIRSLGGRQELSEIKVNGKPFDSLPLEQQTLIILQMFDVKEV